MEDGVSEIDEWFKFREDRLLYVFFLHIYLCCGQSLAEVAEGKVAHRERLALDRAEMVELKSSCLGEREGKPVVHWKSELFPSLLV